MTFESSRRLFTPTTEVRSTEDGITTIMSMATDKLMELQLVYRADFRRRGDTWAIIVCDHTGDPGRETRVKVSARRGELEAGAEYRFFGHWTNNSFGQTFEAKSFVPALPCNKEGIIRCLLKARGIGSVTANRLWEKYGPDAVHILIDQPDRAQREVPQLRAAVVHEACEFLREHQATIDAQCELLHVLGGRGFPQTIFADVMRRYGNRGPELIRRNPFLLCQFSGAGFKRCDALWISLELNPRRLKRQTLCLAHAISKSSSGDTWHSPAFCSRKLAENLSGADPQPTKAVRLGMRAGLLRVHRDDDGLLWVALRRHDDDERAIANVIGQSRHEQSHWPAVDGPRFAGLTAHQREQLQRALTSTICAMVGAPGVGKTHTAGILLRAIVEDYGELAVALAAPTGKAARRLTELARRAGVRLQASTIHSLLGPRRVVDDVWQFAHCAELPLPYQFIVIDETSMLDGQIAAALLSARTPGAHILFVGDPDQLPSVAPGAVLSDMINAGLPHGRLAEIVRNSGTIVRACHAIRNDERFDTDIELSPGRGYNLKHVPRPSTAEAIKATVDLAARLRDKRRVDAQNFQVLAATNKTKDQLNVALRRVFNPAAARTTGRFSVGDKVINLKNRQRPGVDGGEHYVCNGEQGAIAEVSDNKQLVVFSDPYREVWCFGGEDLDHAYAITGHKAQGSEWDYVAVVLETEYGARMCTNRGWLYTSLSRAKRACWLIGPWRVAEAMCRRIGRRKTLLRERIAAP